MRRGFCDAIIRAFGSHPYPAGCPTLRDFARVGILNLKFCNSDPFPILKLPTSLPPRYLRCPTTVPSTSPPKDYTQICETPLHHRTRQGRHEVHLHPLRPQRQHTRLRPPRRQPPHPGRDRYQPARHQRPPRARHVLFARLPAAHLAQLIPPSSKKRKTIRLGVELPRISIHQGDSQ